MEIVQCFPDTSTESLTCWYRATLSSRLRSSFVASRFKLSKLSMLLVSWELEARRRCTGVVMVMVNVVEALASSL